MNRFLALLTLLLVSTPLSGCVSNDTEGPTAFPAFSAVADDNETYDNQRMAGDAYVVVFSAEWCNSPCYATMHALWTAVPELPVLVMSTDPVENAGGLTLSEWHESANAHDDEDDDEGVNLSTYAFMKGDKAAVALEITRPGSLAFVDAEGDIVYLHEGRMDDINDIRAKWELASGSA